MTGFTTHDIAQVLYASTDFLALPFEKNFTCEKYVQWAADNWSVCLGFLAAYIVFLTLGKKWMDSRAAFDLQMPLAFWNGLLCLFSFIGMCRTVPYLIGNVISKPFEETVCAYPVQSWGQGTTGLWVMLFIFSKIPELLDTVFIVLRKKQLIFLHWYHHVTVLLFCWSAYSSIAASGLYFVAMNFTVHAMMYGYYCLQALKVCPKSFPAHLITISQIAQMFVGTGVCISAWYFKLSGSSCHNDMQNLIAGGIMYGSYLYLFCEFAFKRFGPGAKKAKKEKKLE